MTEIDPVAVLAKFVERHSLRQDAAKKLGISPQYLNDLTRGQRPIPDRVLARLGLRRVTRVERVPTRRRKAAPAPV